MKKIFTLILLLICSATYAQSERPLKKYEREIQDYSRTPPDYSRAPAEYKRIDIKIQKSKTYTVERVMDGDTMVVNMDGNPEKVQLIGINAPDADAEGAQEATEFLEGLIVLGPEVYLEFDVQERDQYGRLLAYVYQKVLPWDESPPDYYFDAKERVFLNAALIGDGYAKLRAIPPNVKYADLFQEVYEEARKNKRGLWEERGERNEDECRADVTYVPLGMILKSWGVDEIESESFQFDSCIKRSKEYENCKEIIIMSPHYASSVPQECRLNI